MNGYDSRDSQITLLSACSLKALGSHSAVSQRLSEYPFIQGIQAFISKAFSYSLPVCEVEFN